MSKLKEALKALPKDRIESIAKQAGTTPDYLTDQLANGHRRPSIKLAKKLVRALPGALVLADLRPDLLEESAT